MVSHSLVQRFTVFQTVSNVLCIKAELTTVLLKKTDLNCDGVIKKKNHPRPGILDVSVSGLVYLIESFVCFSTVLQSFEELQCRDGCCHYTLKCISPITPSP